MDRKQFSLLVVLVIVSGFIGGMVSGQVLPVQTENEMQELITAKHIDAKSIKVEAILANNIVVKQTDAKDGGILFINQNNIPRITIVFDEPGDPIISIWDHNHKLRLSLGTGKKYDGAGIVIYDKNSKPRLTLGMQENENGTGIIIYDENGIFRSKWSLVKEDINFGIYSKTDDSAISLASQSMTGTRIIVQNHEHGTVWIRPGSESFGPGIALMEGHMFSQQRATLELAPNKNPQLNLADENGNTRAILGATGTVNKKTGAITNYPENTLTLYNEKGDVLFQRP